MRRVTFKTIICNVLAKYPLNPEAIFYSFIASFEPSLSGLMAREFKIGLIRANNPTAVDESFVFAAVLELIVLLYGFIWFEL